VAIAKSAPVRLLDDVGVDDLSIFKPAEVASFSPENKHTRKWRMAPGKRSVSRKGKTFQDGKGMKGAASIGI
jgi:hypothetical protein